MSKLFALLSFCVILVAVHSEYAEESRHDHDEEGSPWIMLERCDEDFCGDVEECHKCCHHNFHLDYEAAMGNVQAEHDAIDKMCSCFHKVNGHDHNSDNHQ